ncbi:hypothetical protein [Deinococcus petrolearius]|uniref:Uncharacterized protein n=1 Tax=Deinococcus petrolearius TaxID=1751295 RepID=A0ABW1DMQ9_9DEIO
MTGTGHKSDEHLDERGGERGTDSQSATQYPGQNGRGGVVQDGPGVSGINLEQDRGLLDTEGNYIGDTDVLDAARDE